MYSFDLDGVISIGIRPGPDDVIITGRSAEEYKETYKWLHDRGIHNPVFFSPVPFDSKTRLISGIHKSNMIRILGIERHFEDDPVQADVIRKMTKCYVVEVTSDLVNLENERKTGEEND